MSWRVPTFWLLAVLVGIGCGGRTIGGSGNNNSDPGPDAADYPDASIPLPDAGPSYCDDGPYQWLRAWRLNSLYLLQDDPVAEGQTVRIAAGMVFGGCQRLAEVDYQIDHFSRTVMLVGYVWEDLGPNVVCPDDERYEEEIITIPNPAAGQWRVAEASSGVPAMETWFEVTICGGAIDCYCDTYDPDPLGWIMDPCTFNCECDPSLQCLQHWGFGPFSICGRSCSVDADCHGWELCLFTDDGPWGVCDEQPGVNQCPIEGCPPGFECYINAGGSEYCQATFSMTDEGGQCDCDQECPVGMRCIDFGADAYPSCHAICRGDRDCPGGMCGDYLPDTPPLCIMMWM